MNDTPPPAVRYLGKAGFAAKGIIYMGIAVLAALVALGYASDPEGMQGTLRTLADLPFGGILMWILAFGLAAYALWRWVEAIYNPNDEDGAKGTVKRIAYAISGTIYAALAFAAFRIATGSGSGGGGGGEGQTERTLTAQVLEWPGGQWIVGAVGLILIGVGLYQFKRAASASFMHKYGLQTHDAETRETVRKAGRFGFAARGISFGLIGWFVIQAALNHNPNQTRGLDGALETIAAQPFGQILLGLFAIGLAGYAVYCWALARYATFRPAARNEWTPLARA
jgi:hypothetical protein